MPKIGITAHLVVKNEDQWVWFAVQSVLPYVDQVLLTDTGSTDRTIELIKSISSDKIIYNQTITRSPAEITAVRQQQIDSTKTPWSWTVDGDEIYTRKGAQEIVTAVKSSQYKVIVVRRYDLLGDIYHRQRESVGTYNLYGASGHLLVRLVDKTKIPGLHLQGDYPLEGYYDNRGQSILDIDKKDVYITKESLYHAMYLRRSSLGSKLSFMPNRSKYKVETGLQIHSQIPEVFSLPRPVALPDPLRKRGLTYELAAAAVTPVKNLKRNILNTKY